MKNATLVETAEKRQDQLNKQANIIGELRSNMNKLEIETNEKDIEIKRINDMNNELVLTLVSRDDTINDLEERLTQFLDVLIEPTMNQYAPNFQEVKRVGHENQVEQSAFKDNNEGAGNGAASQATHGEEMEEDEEEITAIHASKTSGYTRAGPQTGAIPKEYKNKMDEHTEKLNCTECPETRNSGAQMAAHMNCHRHPGINKCDDCSYKSNVKEHLNNHLKHTRHTGTFREYICYECRLDFKSEQEKESHMETHGPDGATAVQTDHEGAAFECPICGHTGNTRSKIEKHMECHDNDEEDSTFLCVDCSFQSMNRDQLLEHLETKHDKHICNTCNIACISRNDLNKHIAQSHKSHKPCREYATNSCDYKSECKYRHIKLKHNEQICYTCGKRTQTIKELMAHIKDVHGSQPCTKYAKGQCDRGSKCWYNHSKTNIHSNQSPSTARLECFQKVIPIPHPQIQVQKLSEEGQRQIVVQETQKIVTQMMPVLVKQILESMSGNQTPQ